MCYIWRNKLLFIHSITKKHNFMDIVKNFQTFWVNFLDFAQIFDKSKLLRELHPQLPRHCVWAMNDNMGRDAVKMISNLLIHWLLFVPVENLGTGKPTPFYMRRCLVMELSIPYPPGNQIVMMRNNFIGKAKEVCRRIKTSKIFGMLFL